MPEPYDVLKICIEKGEYSRYIELLARYAGDYSKEAEEKIQDSEEDTDTDEACGNAYRRLVTLKLSNLRKLLDEQNWEKEGEEGKKGALNVQKAIYLTEFVEFYQHIYDPDAERSDDGIERLLSSPYYAKRCEMKSIPAGAAYIATAKFEYCSCCQRYDLLDRKDLYQQQQQNES